MSLHLASARLVIGSEAPVEPERDEARRWAVEELSKQHYLQAQPNWLEERWQEFLDWLHGLNGEGQGWGNDVGLPLIGAVAVVLIALAIILVRPRLNARRKEAGNIFDDEPSVSAETYRQRAAAASARQDWATAVVEHFRAIVRSAEDRAVIDAQPGRTADEVARQLGVAFSEASSELVSAAWLFDSVRYGKAKASAGEYASLQALDKRLLSMKADYAGQDPKIPAAPK
jgi:hypothetical protein